MSTVTALAGGFVILISSAFLIYIFGQADSAAHAQGVALMGSNVYQTSMYTVMSSVTSLLAVIVAFVAFIYVIRHARKRNPYEQ